MRRAGIERFGVERVDDAAAYVLILRVDQQDHEIKRGTLVIEPVDIPAHHYSLDVALLLHRIGDVGQRKRKAGLHGQGFVLEVLAGLETVDGSGVAGGLFRLCIRELLVDQLRFLDPPHPLQQQCMTNDYRADMRKDDALRIKLVFRRLDNGRRQGIINGEGFFVPARCFQHGRQRQVRRDARHAARDFAVPVDGAFQVAFEGGQPGVDPEIEARLFEIVCRVARQAEIGAGSGHVAGCRAVDRQIGIEEPVIAARLLGLRREQGKVPCRIAGFKRIDRRCVDRPKAIRLADRRGERRGRQGWSCSFCGQP